MLTNARHFTVPKFDQPLCAQYNVLKTTLKPKSIHQILNLSQDISEFCFHSLISQPARKADNSLSVCLDSVTAAGPSFLSRRCHSV